MSDDTTLQGKSALVTGASSGIGEATARVLAERGSNVAVAARREGRLENIAATIREEYGVETAVFPTDVTEEDQVEATVSGTVDAFGGLDVLVNNAGLGRDGDVEDLSTEKYRDMMEVNVDGTFFAARAAIPHLKESRGNLIFLGSFAGQYPRPFNPVYAATKWWTRGFAHSIAGDVGDDEVAVTIVNPTEVRTEFGSEDGDPLKAEFERGEVAEPRDVAEAIAFAAERDPPNSVNELDLYRRDKFSHF